MRTLILTATAVAALATTPSFVLAQGGPGGPGPDRGPGAADHGPARGDRGPDRADPRSDQGPRGGDRDRADRDRGDRDHADRARDDRGADRARGDRDADRARGDRDDRVRVDERGRDDRVRGDRDRVRVDERVRDDRVGRDRGDVRVDERVTRDRRDVERVGRPGPRRVTVEERGRFRERIGRLGGERIRGGDFAVRVGGRLPDRYRFARLPPELVEVVPEYRDYDYVRVDDRVLILDPETREIVDVID